MVRTYQTSNLASTILVIFPAGTKGWMNLTVEAVSVRGLKAMDGLVVRGRPVTRALRHDKKAQAGRPRLSSFEGPLPRAFWTLYGPYFRKTAESSNGLSSKLLKEYFLPSDSPSAPGALWVAAAWARLRCNASSTMTRHRLDRRALHPDPRRSQRDPRDFCHGLLAHVCHL